MPRSGSPGLPCSARAQIQRQREVLRSRMLLIFLPSTTNNHHHQESDSPSTSHDLPLLPTPFSPPSISISLPTSCHSSPPSSSFSPPNSTPHQPLHRARAVSEAFHFTSDIFSAPSHACSSERTPVSSSRAKSLACHCHCDSISLALDIIACVSVPLWNMILVQDY